MIGKSALKTLSIFFLASSACAIADDLQPVVRTLPSQRMLVVRRAGNPDKVAGQAFNELFRVYYRDASKAEKKSHPAPRARWALPLDPSRKDEWAGSYALPISEEFPIIRDSNIDVETWEYGLVAEILHLGPYSNEGADIAKLNAYIATNGMQIIGDHEEEYVKGPGPFFKGKSKNYRTVIRYRVAPVRQLDAPLVKKVP